ncbi:hypothetical protein EDB89DRAFT_1904853 [Lactarius sanguifluus]|nr:hypothetical protein EDB89DRAFT_1904853 [Lactarius sanguifluus]
MYCNLLCYLQCPPALSLHPVAVAYWHRFRVTAATVVVVGVIADHGLSSWSWSTYCRWSAGGGLLSLYGWPAIVVVQAHTKVVVVVQLTDDAELPTPGDCQFRKCGTGPQAGPSHQQQVSVSDDNDATTTTERRQSTMARSMPNDGAMPAPARRRRQTTDTFGRRGDDDDYDRATPVDHNKAIPIDHDDEATQQ